MFSKSGQISIGRYSTITRLTQKALRYYDKKGLLIPEIKDMATGYRYYTMDQIEIGIKIKYMTELGFSLDQISDLMELRNNRSLFKESISEIIKKRLYNVQNEINRLKLIENVLIESIELENIELSELKIEIKELPEIRVISKKGIGSYGEVIPRLMGDLMGEIYKKENQTGNVQIVGPPMFICHDQEFKENDASIEMAMPITGKVNVDQDYEVKSLEKTKVASYVHKGPYDSISEGYGKLMKYITENNLEIKGNSRELYLNNPQEVKPTDVLTEIQFPID